MPHIQGPVSSETFSTGETVASEDTLNALSQSIYFYLIGVYLMRLLVAQISGLESLKYGRGGPLRRPRETLYPQKLALTLPTSGGRLVGVVRSRTKATELVLWVCVRRRNSACIR
jgi:hypothetical protein